MIYRKRNSSDCILYAGLFVGVISITIDTIGVQTSLWDYKRPVTPVSPSLIPFDLSLLPICVMFLIKYFY
ncbi:CBO0543 family protein [Bacillus sp. ISL-18]|uniref:CBO0543 family protein n=1 Tax=Bacillus sp. ISL-18 TaxID=2819118 RepID=UPI0035A95554